jgi:Flp pilus assembly protein TadB
MKNSNADSSSPAEHHKNSSEGEKSFRKGNINFDILEPENPVNLLNADLKNQKYPETENSIDKRGIFESGRKINPVQFYQVFVWVLTFIVSIFLLGVIIFVARSVFWMLVLPVVLLSSIWSFIMLVLFKARPR